MLHLLYTDYFLGLCFLGGGEIAEVVSIMSTLESVFSSSYTKPDLSPEMSSLHSACLSGWALLLSLMSPGEVSKSANNYIQKFEKMLLATDVELRITAGEAIALILEFAYDYDEVRAKSDSKFFLELKGSGFYWL